MKYRFSDVDIDLNSQELRRQGSVVQVEPQVFDLICFLVRNRATLVTHQQLVNAVWRGRVVSDSAIAARISSARKALGDSGKTQTIIKTLPRKGFRFVAEVKETPDAPGKGDHSIDTTGPEEPAGPTKPTSGTDHQQVRFCTSRDGTELAYARSGNGVPLVRAGHWLTHLKHDWDSPIWRPFLSKLGKQFSVVRYDQRGNGLSDRDVTDFSLERCVEDLDAVVEAAGLDQFVLYATSQGVPIAIEYAARNPQRITHLVLHGGFAKGRLVRENTSWKEQGEAIQTLIKHGWGKTGSPFIIAFTAMFIPNGTREQMDSLADLQRLTTNATNAIGLRKAIDRFDVSDRLKDVRVKTLVMHARDDGVHPMDQSRLLAGGIADSEFILLDSANHVILPQEPEWQTFFIELERFVRI